MTVKPSGFNQPLSFTLLISLALHAMVLLPAYYFLPNEQASSFGHSQVILLEPSQLKPNLSHHKESQNQSVQAKTSLENKKSSQLGQSKQDKQTDSPQPTNSKTQSAKIKQTTSNQGSLVNQSGKSLTPAQHYNIVVQQHLLNKMQSAPYFGKAQVELKLMSAGVAIQVEVKVLQGPAEYGLWLKKVVLAANPFPVVPKNVQEKGFASIRLKLQHQPDNKQ